MYSNCRIYFIEWFYFNDTNVELFSILLKQLRDFYSLSRYIIISNIDDTTMNGVRNIKYFAEDKWRVDCTFCRLLAYTSFHTTKDTVAPQ